jgi:hypothetical protein
MATIKTQISIQDEYVATVNSAIARWSHRRGIPGIAYGVGGHAGRIIGGAHRKAEAQLRKLGFSDAQIKTAIADARDMAELIRRAEVE